MFVKRVAERQSADAVDGGLAAPTTASASQVAEIIDPNALARGL
jgi:hypothetical protein